MNEFALFHIADIPYSYPEDENTLTIRLRTAAGDLKSCVLFYRDRYESHVPYRTAVMKVEASTTLFDYYGARISVEENRYRYFFRLEGTDGKIVFLHARGLAQTEPDDLAAFQFPYIAKADVYHGVQWAEEGIVYQIFPDRFYNADKNNDPVETLPWGAPVTPRSMFGGDIKGITEKIPYLAGLGVTFLYLTPIFLSSSNHKYNTYDYYQIDPHFGTLEDVKEMVSVCHAHKIRILFDAVFNHCGIGFFAFNDVLENGENSKYKDWFFLHDFPVDVHRVNYSTFGIKGGFMPKLNTSNPEVSDYLLGVSKYWIQEVGIDGWRLDVCDEVDHVFWREFRKTVKSANPDALIVGEIMHEASSFLRGDQVDSIMNYPFRESVKSYFAKRTVSTRQFEDELTAARMQYMDVINRTMLNLLCSHDTERFLSSCGGKTERMKCTAVFQFTYIGVPYIYYGDEIAMDGGKDPECRKCMIWNTDKQNSDLLGLFKKLCSIRKENACLVYGGYRSLSNGNVLAFSRDYNGSSVIVVINNSDCSRSIEFSELNGNFRDLLNDTDVSLNGSLSLSPNSYQILKPL